MKKTAITLSVLLSVCGSTSYALETAPLWLRDAKISPDGKNIAFTYKGDIYTVPTQGGKALRLTSRESYEQLPIWSPDSKSIAFASDLNGNFDIFVMSADTPGQWRQLTFDSANELPETFSPDGSKIIFSAAIQDPATSALFPTSRMTEVYSVPVKGGKTSQILGTPANYINFSQNGKQFLYQDVKSFEDNFRKHHTSSATRDIWLYDIASNTHRQIMDRPGEDLNPVFGTSDEFFFLSERDGDKSINVWKTSLENPAQAQRITNFKTHPVRFLSRSSNGTLAFTYDGEIYTLSDGSKQPKKVSISIASDNDNQIRKVTQTYASEPSASPDGKSVAFIARGDVFVTSVDYPTTKQISNTPQAEGDVTWGDEKTLYYTSERDGKYNIYKATIERSDEEPSFEYATIIKEEPVFKADSHERMMPQVSPDGEKLAFILDRTQLAVKDLKSGKVKLLTDGSTHRQRSGGFPFRWSPDSKWIVFELTPKKHDPYTDIAIINVETAEITNITQSGYFDGNPRWALDGNAIIFESERYGMRNHASWGSESDVLIVFLNQKALNDFSRDKEDIALDKEIEKLKKKKEEADLDKKDKKEKENKDSKDEDDKSIVVELDGIENRIHRLTPISTLLSDEIVSEDGKTLYFISRTPEGSALWSMDLVEGDVSMKKKLSSSAYFFSSPNGKELFLRSGNTISKFDGSSTTPISLRAELKLDPMAEREFMFDNMTREEAERFYVKDMHGVDWDALTKTYRKFLPHINNNYDFAELLSELLGELNVSHTGGRFYGVSPSSNPSKTAKLGALYDLSYEGPGVKIDEILAQGPLFLADQSLSPGTVILSVNGNEITEQETLSQLLDGTAGKRTLLTIREPESKETRQIVVKPISTYAENQILYDRWVKARAADVERWSNGRLGYVHISSMDDNSFRKVYSDLLGKYNDKEGVVIDIRWNGGGRLHEDIEVLFSGEKYFTQEIRGEETCDMPSRRWNKPSIMLMAEACYSNAHGTPWVYKHKNLGKLVGMPVAGTMTSVNWVTMQDPDLVYGIPVVGYRLPDGSFLENQQLEPDIKVANDPSKIVLGEDTQLHVAVDELLKELNSKSK